MPAVEGVVGHGERAPLLLAGRAQAVQLVLSVVALDEHLEQRLLLGEAVLEPLGEEAHDLLGDGRERVDPGGPVGGLRVGSQGGHLVADAGQDTGAGLVDQGLVEPAEPDAPGEVAHDGEPELGRDDEAVEDLAGRVVDRRLGPRLRQPALQQGGREVHVGGAALLGQEDAEDRLLELGGAVEGRDPVVLQHAGELAAELLGQRAALDVEALQVGVEVLPGAVHPVLGVHLLVGRTVAAELGEVGEHPERRDLLVERRPSLCGELVAGREVVLQGPALVAGVDVVAEHHRRQVGAAPGGALGCRGLGRGRSVEVEVDRPGGRGLLGHLVRVSHRLEPDQRGPRLHLAAGCHQQLPDPGRERRGQHGLHLHRLEHQDRRPGRDLVAGRDRGGHHQGGGRGAQDAALVAADPVGHPVDLDELHRAVGRGDQAVGAARDGQAAGVVVDAVEVGVDEAARRRRPRSPPGSGAGPCGPR